MSKKKEEKVCEKFEIQEDEEKTFIESCGVLKEKKPTKEQIIKENKTLIWVFVVVGMIILLGFATFFYSKSLKKFEYQGIKFDIIKDQGGRIFYHTEIPIVKNKTNFRYNVYLRNDPRKLEEVETAIMGIQGADFVILNMTNSFNCDGDGVIAIANMGQILDGLFDTKIAKNSTLVCDSLGRYVHINIKEGNKTKIQQTDKKCFDFYVNNCEILKVTEKFLVEVLVKIKN